jgi:type II secretory pathway component PulF
MRPFAGQQLQPLRSHSLTYPCVVLSTSLGAVFFMLKFVVPMFGDVFKRFGGQLPWITEKIISVSQAMENNFYGLVFVITIVAGLIWYSRKTERYRQFISALVLRIPLAISLLWVHRSARPACLSQHETVLDVSCNQYLASRHTCQSQN